MTPFEAHTANAAKNGLWEAHLLKTNDAEGLLMKGTESARGLAQSKTQAGSSARHISECFGVRLSSAAFLPGESLQSA